MVKRTVAIGETVDRAELLVNAPQPTFAGKSLRELVHDGRVDAVVAYLESLEASFTG